MFMCVFFKGIVSGISLSLSLLLLCVILCVLDMFLTVLFVLCLISIHFISNILIHGTVLKWFL